MAILPVEFLAVGALAVGAFTGGFLAYQMVADLLRYTGDPYKPDLPTLSTRKLCALALAAAALLATGYAALP
ncbi:hypothetical protein [Pseudosulfitobacter pseudonitzschiae]|uniref:hypothetical protein n=1 Tax=Pseudosulfitobacter pseudonitzschiae TaxID=1402135 RepID=UPI001AF69560|nr:hypothetical protein [Pseudosulfitobacter pseudonitzschiae]MBM1814919.1 hypothetical protein [Pseudosulfitobacter pseudonitzschiae]MBM1831913.1 hypothetical protein [Pseudosulfitobacter pseudonitzschiae]MBM1836778.1 hypothetical protein [Pseudosulfitobacter pseudonitzschiae]MBM1841625.1 hypothetical protein [Pseudosulfitobacter pseudonitzschiae]MBM1846492.1 hypothetical protein [Pseudosulfitobacter pseudonitzschiae]